MIFRSPRLATLFGASPETVTYEQLTALVGDHAAAEAEDLDYKLRYESGEEGTQDIAIDIATFANHRGGVIIVGMADANAIPSKAVGVDLSDAAKRRIDGAAAERIFPMPQYSVRMVADPATIRDKIPKGLMLIIVPPSSHAPHAVIRPGDNGIIRWPRRHGSKKIWLSESEIAAAYRRRFTAAADQSQRLAEVARDVVNGINKMERRGKIGALLTISLAPDIPGDLIVDQEAFQRFQHEIQQKNVLVDATGSPEMPHAGVGRRRLVCYSGADMFNTRAEFHSDGAGSLATQLPAASFTASGVSIWDTLIVIWVASALRFLARHARDRAGASGIAATSVSITPYGLRIQNSPNEMGGVLKLVTPSHLAPGYRAYGDEHGAAAGHGDFLLDDLADDGQPLAAATAQLVGDLFQSFNAIGTRQITRDGVLQRNAWGSDWSTVRAWADRADIAVRDG
jgi:hypothetical protein